MGLSSALLILWVGQLCEQSFVLATTTYGWLQLLLAWVRFSTASIVVATNKAYLLDLSLYPMKLLCDVGGFFVVIALLARMSIQIANRLAIKLIILRQVVY